jgi:hypothetical protein
VLPWKKLLEDARSARIDRNPELARGWIRQQLPELCVWYVKRNGKAGFHRERFNWEAEWPKWRDCFRALHWLARARAHATKQRIPPWVQHLVDEVIGQTRNVLSSDWLSEARLRVQLSGGFQASGRFASLDEFWQAVFVSFFEPTDLPWGYCGDCGKPLARTSKLQKTSRSKLCGACRVKKWRRDHPEAAREMWRRSKTSPST